MSHITCTLETFLDTSITWNLADAARFHSMHLLRRIAARQTTQWTDLPPKLIKCRRQQTFMEAMNAMAQYGFIAGAQWLIEEYFPNAQMTNVTPIASANGQADFLAWLLDKFRDSQKIDPLSLLHAVQRGYLEVLRVLWSKQQHHVLSLKNINDASKFADLPIIQFFHTHSPKFDSRDAMDMAAKSGNLELMIWLHEHRFEMFTERLFNHAVWSGHVHIVHYIHKHYHRVAACTNRMMNVAASHGYMELFKWLYANRTEEYQPQWIARPVLLLRWREGKTSDGHWDVCKWLYEHKYECLPEFVAVAMISGNLPMLQWLYDKYRLVVARNASLFTSDAASHGCLETLQWLDSIGCEFCELAVIGAVEGGHLSVVKWLHERHGLELWSRRAMDTAAALGHLDVIRYLHLYQHARCTTKAMDKAAQFNHIAVVEFLHENRTEGCTTDAMDRTTSVEILDYLHRNRKEGCTEQAIEFALAWGNLQAIEWFYKYKRKLVNLARVREKAQEAKLYHILYWVEAMEAGEVEVG